MTKEKVDRGSFQLDSTKMIECFQSEKKSKTRSRRKMHVPIKCSWNHQKIVFLKNIKFIHSIIRNRSTGPCRLTSYNDERRILNLVIGDKDKWRSQNCFDNYWRPHGVGSYTILKKIYIYIYIFDIIESEKFQSIIRSHVLRSRFHYIYSVTNRKFPSVIE